MVSEKIISIKKKKALEGDEEAVLWLKRNGLWKTAEIAESKRQVSRINIRYNSQKSEFVGQIKESIKIKVSARLDKDLLLEITRREGKNFSKKLRDVILRGLQC